MVWLSLLYDHLSAFTVFILLERLFLFECLVAILSSFVNIFSFPCSPHPTSDIFLELCVYFLIMHYPPLVKNFSFFSVNSSQFFLCSLLMFLLILFHSSGLTVDCCLVIDWLFQYFYIDFINRLGNGAWVMLIRNELLLPSLICSAAFQISLFYHSTLQEILLRPY